MSFAKVESEIVRDADMDGTLKKTSASLIKDWLATSALDLSDDPFSDPEQLIGETAKYLILLCAKLDLDLTTCIRKAVEK